MDWLILISVLGPMLAVYVWRWSGHGKWPFE